MLRLARNHRPGAGRAFTLIELLLTTVLILLLASAAVFNFTTLQRGSELEEGSRQVEALLRFARAQAEVTGRQVQINFEEEMDEGFTLSLGGIRVLWESDPVGDPGTLTEMPDAVNFIRGITDLVEVENVRLTDANSSEGSSPETVPGSEQDDLLGEELFELFPPITFHPDGSGESAEIVLRSRDVDDRRRVAVRIAGLTGSIRREYIAEDLGEDFEFDEELMAPEPGTRKSAGTRVSPPASVGSAAPTESPTLK